MPKPMINVTPLIDVLLVLLIIFMVVAPIKPSSFKARLPAEQRDWPADAPADPYTLAVIIGTDSSIRLNAEKNLGTSDDPTPLSVRLKEVFRQRVANGAVSEAFGDDPQRPFPDRVERTVFIKAPRAASYGSVARVVDAVKLAGAYPISLQIDGLD